MKNAVYTFLFYFFYTLLLLLFYGFHSNRDKMLLCNHVTLETLLYILCVHLYMLLGIL